MLDHFPPAEEARRVAYFFPKVDWRPFRRRGGTLAAGLIVAAVTVLTVLDVPEEEVVDRLTFLEQPATQHLLDHLGNSLHSGRNQQSLCFAIDASLDRSTPVPNCASAIQEQDDLIRQSVTDLRNDAQRLSLHDVAGDLFGLNVLWGSPEISAVMEWSSKSAENRNPEFFNDAHDLDRW